VTKSGAQVAEELAGEVRGELLFDPISCALFSTDASIFQVQPLGVIAPADEADVQAVVRYAGENGIPLTARGAGSGLAGESLGAGLVLDFTRHFTQILDVGTDTVRVQPGVVYRNLAELLAKVGRRFAPDPASGAQCTLGGMLANNASGANALKYGYTRDYVQSLRVVFDNGEVDTAGSELAAKADAPGSRKATLLAGLLPLLEANAELIRGCQPRTRFNRCGYLLHDIVANGRVELAKLLVGSEGTLGLITEATLKTIPLPVDRAMVLLGFRSLESAAQSAALCLPAGPAACELLDRRLLTLTCGADPEYERVLPTGTEAVLLVGFEADEAGEARRAAEVLLREFRGLRLLTTAVVAFDSERIAWLWRLRDLALPLLYAMPGTAHPIPYVEDVGVPAESLAPFLHKTQDILQRHEVTASFLVHAGAGQVHTRPFLDLRQPDNWNRLRRLTEEIYHLAVGLGGTISTQHAVGLARTPWVLHQYGRLFPVFREVKALFDPKNILNPGKIVGGPEAATATLRRDSPGDTPDPRWRLRWAEQELRGAVHACNGCGACRTEASGARMCPLFRVEHTEAATPRAKANLLRALLGGLLPQDELEGDAVRAVADLCINCKMCALECPAHVNIPKLMLEAKAHHAAAEGLKLADWLLSRVEGFAAMVSRFAWLVNGVLGSRWLRWTLSRFVGLSHRRRLPRLANESFVRMAERRGWTRAPGDRGRPRVAYFADFFANYMDPSIALATVEVLHHQGIEVYVPPQQASCGIAPLVCGDVETAQALAAKNLRILGDLARAGYTIVCSEPTAAVTFRVDYLDLLDDPDVRLVGERTRELTSFLWDLHGQGRLQTDFQPLPLTVGHHVPCHVKALGQGVHGPGLLSLIPQLRVVTIDVSCSGMAGTFGLKEENFETSLAAGEPMLRRFREEHLHFGSSECSACRMQMEQGAGKRSMHPVQYLALAYGLMPGLERRLREPLRERVT